MSDELTQIVILPPCADNGLAIAEDREIPFLRNPKGIPLLEAARDPASWIGGWLHTALEKQTGSGRASGISARPTKLRWLATGF